MATKKKELPAPTEPASVDASRWDFLNKETPPGLFLSASGDDLYLISDSPFGKFYVILSSYQSTEMVASKLKKAAIAFGTWFGSFSVTVHHSGDREPGFGLLLIFSGEVQIQCRRLNGSTLYLPVAVAHPDLSNRRGRFMRWTLTFGDHSYDFGFISKNDPNFVEDDEVGVSAATVNPIQIPIHDHGIDWQKASSYPKSPPW